MSRNLHLIQISLDDYAPRNRARLAAAAIAVAAVSVLIMIAPVEEVTREADMTAASSQQAAP